MWAGMAQGLYTDRLAVARASVEHCISLARCRLMEPVFRALTALGVATAHPIAFAVVALYVVAWLLFEHQSFDWVSGAAVATLFMTLIIQRAEHRDTQAIHAKLDELLRVEGRARNELMKLDQEEPEKIEAQRQKEFRDR
jgi:low affinity Fe/Cu permease